MEGFIEIISVNTHICSDRLLNLLLSMPNQHNTSTLNLSRQNISAFSLFMALFTREEWKALVLNLNIGV